MLRGRMWSLESKDTTSDSMWRWSPRFQWLQRLGGKTRSRRPSLRRPVWSMPPERFKMLQAQEKKQDRGLMNSWPSIRGKELLRIEVINQTVLMA
jgi:hypothetical protein